MERRDDYPVCRYDAENDSEKNLEACFPSFEAMMMYEMLDAVSGSLYEDFLDAAADDDEEKIERIEEFFPA